MNALEVVHNHANEEIDGEEEAHEHPCNEKERSQAEIVAHGCSADTGCVHCLKHHLYPLITGGRHIQHQHGLPNVVERAERRIQPAAFNHEPSAPYATNLALLQLGSRSKG
eukprot:6205486-Prymnesium_polylepis.1